MVVAAPLPEAAAAEPLLAYHLLRIAHEHFHCAPEALDGPRQHEARQIALRQLLIENAVLASPEAVGVAVPAASVEAALAGVREHYRGEDGALDCAAMARDLEGQGLDEGGLRRALERQLRVEAVVERAVPMPEPVGETEASLYYYLHVADFTRPEQRRARHILVTVNEQFAENARDRARARLEAIAGRLRRDPGRFSEQALKHSECPTSLQGGLLGTLRRGVLYPELDAVLFALREGEISVVAESPLGFHLLCCEQVLPETVLPLAEVMPRLRTHLAEQQRRRQQKLWLAGLLAPAAAKGDLT
jgi:peptidyl-prolyl cis-trans isomerase C